MAENWIFLWDLPKSLKVPRIYLGGLVMMHKLTHVNIVRDNFICLLWQKMVPLFHACINLTFRRSLPCFPCRGSCCRGVAGVIVSSASLRPVLIVILIIVSRGKNGRIGDIRHS